MQAIKDTIFFVAIFTVILCLLAFVPIEALYSLLLVSVTIFCVGYMIVQEIEDIKQTKAKEAFYKKLCE